MPDDEETSHVGDFVVSADEDHLSADKGERGEQVCESCHSAGYVRRVP